MKETIISFETAKLAKEKGFDIPTNKMFSVTTDYTIFNKTDNPEIIKFHDGDKHQCSETPYNWNAKVSQTFTKYCSAPTQSLLQKWLREVHNEIVLITITYSESNKILYDYEHYSTLITKEINYEDGLFNTYDEALEVGLLKALKLMK